MTDDNVKQRGLKYAEYLSALSSEDRARINESTRKQGEYEHKACRAKCATLAQLTATFRLHEGKGY
jgi:hypothetical protein